MNRWFTGRPWEPEDISPHQTEFATSLRVPFLNSIYPRWNFITGIAVDDLYNGIAPTDEEVEVVSELVKSYKDYFFGQNAFRMEMEAFAPYASMGAPSASTSSSTLMRPGPTAEVRGEMVIRSARATMSPK